MNEGAIDFDIRLKKEAVEFFVKDTGIGILLSSNLLF
jgi:hypothetical protein